MNNIKFIFTNENNSDNMVTLSAEANSIYIIEKEGEYPKATLKFHSKYYQSLNSFEICEIFRNDELFFKGRIESLSTYKDEMNIDLITYREDIYDEFPKNDEELNEDIFVKFKKENPDLFTKINNTEFSRIGDITETPKLNPKSDDEVIEMENNIINESLKFKKDDCKIISGIDLEISGSWIYDVSGDIDLTNKISNKFKNGKISTLTPNKLKDSWPKLFEKLAISKFETDDEKIYKSNGYTKYFIGKSKLDEERNIKVPVNIKFDDEATKEITLNQTFFDHKLTLSWEYQQFITEKFKAIIYNNFSKQNNVKKIKINLKNIQEYIEDNHQKSFFESNFGRSVIKEIICGIGNYMAISMRNIEASFDLPMTEETMKLSCNSWIRVNNHILKITEIEMNITENDDDEKNILKIKAMGFSNPISHNDDYSEFLKTPEFLNTEEKIINPDDVIHDISVYNDSISQLQKFYKHINELSLSKINYKNRINKFLNSIQTKIMIIAKPLKKKHMEIKIIDIKEPILFMNETNGSFRRKWC